MLNILIGYISIQNINISYMEEVGELSFWLFYFLIKYFIDLKIIY